MKTEIRDFCDPGEGIAALAVYNIYPVGQVRTDLHACLRCGDEITRILKILGVLYNFD